VQITCAISRELCRIVSAHSGDAVTSYYVGIDGGGSRLRVVVVTGDLQICAEASGDSANPSVVGRDEAANRIQMSVGSALSSARLSPNLISAVGIGIAGAAAAHSADWLRTVIGEVLPDAKIALSSDFEIALVGANGARYGVLILAGTGSVACGINDSGDYLKIGGWGYLIGDEGSGFWIGREALRAVTRAFDVRAPSTLLTDKILNALELQSPAEIISWLYGSQSAQTPTVAGLAPLVLDAAATGDPVAVSIINSAADELALLGQTVCQRLNIRAPKFAFAGGLLQNPNPLSERLCARLGLSDYPQPQYPPVIGAALLARLTHQGD
jgi:glucosamine kinase